MKSNVCSTCSILTNAKNKTQKGAKCDVCRKQAARETYLKYRDKRIKEACIWGKKNRELTRQYSARARNKAKELDPIAYKKKWANVYSSNKKKDPVRFKLYAVNRKARDRGAKSTIPIKELREMLLSANGLCSYCGISGATLSFDHVVPMSRSGEHVLSNLRIACISCNHRKKSRTLKEFKEYCARKGKALII